MFSAVEVHRKCAFTVCTKFARLGIHTRLRRRHISLMKTRFFVSDRITPAKPYQIGSTENGALALACQRAQPYLVAARAAGTRDVYARAFDRWAQWCAAMHTRDRKSTRLNSSHRL